MIHIGSGYRHYEDLINRIGEERIKARYEFLHEQMLQFIAGFDRERNGIGNRLSINEHALMHAILEYFEDIEKVKSAHDLEHTNSPKIQAYMSYWILRRHPIQLLSIDCDDDLVFVNEKFVLSMLMSFLTLGAESKTLSELDRDMYKSFANTFYYFLKFRRLDPQSIEMILLSFRFGGVYPECKDVQ